jgi:site-specific recombinase XerD
MQAYRKPILGLSTIRSTRFLEVFQDYGKELVRAGYTPNVARLHLRSIVHFGVWLELEGVALESIDEQTVAMFDRHRSSCRCPGPSRDCGRHVLSCIRAFLNHLRKRRIVETNAPPEPPCLVREFLSWMSTHRGIVDTTLRSYRCYVTHLVDSLGDDPQTYTAGNLRDFVAKRYRHYGRNSIRMVLAAVRMFLRYLAVEGRCRPGLEQALVSPANWSQHSLPRGLTAQQVQSILAACPSTPRGIRDRAILLLLIRLGLRAGDVAALRLSDLCFQTATIRVSGKGGREVRLPLPQDVGDALLAYLDTGRPRVPSDRLFLRSIAPFKPFSGAQAGHAITHVARSALKHAGVQPPICGAHVFRHTAACQMLRQDVGLEDIAAVLRHRSIETTALYAKVDLRLLEQVAQPWPEVVSC